MELLSASPAEWAPHPLVPGLDVLVRPFDCKEGRAFRRRELNRQTKLRREAAMGVGDEEMLALRAMLAQAAGCCAGWETKDGEPVTVGGVAFEYSEKTLWGFVDRAGELYDFLNGIYVLAQRLQAKRAPRPAPEKTPGSGAGNGSGEDPQLDPEELGIEPLEAEEGDGAEAADEDPDAPDPAEEDRSPLPD